MFAKDSVSGVIRTPLCDSFGKLIIAPKYYDAAINGRLFSVANQAAVATTAALATTWTGLGVANPTGSGKNFVFYEFGWSMAVAGSDDGAVGLMTATPGDMAAALTAKPAMNGKGSSVSYCDNGATPGTPILERICGDYGTGATNLFTGVGPHIYQIEGSIILPPGRALLNYTTTATTAAFIFYFLWEEIPTT